MNKQSVQERIEEFIYDYPVCEFALLTPCELNFSDKVRYICEHECTNYGKSWACPPGIEQIEICIEKCRAFDYVFLFTSVAEVPDCMDFGACLQARRGHEQMTRDIKKRFEERFGGTLALSTGCTICDNCAYPDHPCRNPIERLSTIESHGILIMETAGSLGISLDCGNNMVTYFSLIFFSAQP
jgi:predicted metal-binding protein